MNDILHIEETTDHAAAQFMMIGDALARYEAQRETMPHSAADWLARAVDLAAKGEKQMRDEWRTAMMARTRFEVSLDETERDESEPNGIELESSWWSVTTYGERVAA